MGYLEEARQSYRNALGCFELGRENDTEWNVCVANYAIGMIAQCIDDWGEAIKLFISAANGFKALSIKLAEEEKAGADKAIR